MTVEGAQGANLAEAVEAVGEPAAEPQSVEGQGSEPGEDTGSGELALLKKQLAEVLKDNKKYRDERRKREEDELEKKGEYEKLVGTLRQELEPLKTKAQQWDDYVEGQTAALEKEAKALPKADRELVEAQPTIELKRKMLDRLKSVPTQVPEPPPAADPSPESAPADSVDFAAKMAEGISLRELKKRYPEAWKAKVNGNSGRKGTMFSSLLRK